MKFIVGLFIFWGLSASVQARLNCGADIHPSDKAVCLLKQLIADGSNPEINRRVKSFIAEGLKPSTEVGAVFVGGSCDSQRCSYKYIVSTDYYNHKTFKSVVLVIEAAQGTREPKLRKVFDQSDL